MATYDRIETDNPLLDEVIYAAKLIMKSCVLKDEETANNMETVESLRNWETYRAIKENRARIYMFDIDETDMKAAGIPDSEEDKNKEIRYIIDEFIYDMNGLKDYCIENNKTYYDDLLNHLIKCFIKNYEEENEYYRQVCGMPPLTDTEENFIYLTNSDIEDIGLTTIDITVPLHKMSISVLLLLERKGIIDKYIDMYPTKGYLKFISKGIKPEEARLAENNGILYVNDEVNDTLLERFKELLPKNAAYYEKILSNDAYSLFSVYYDKFVSIIIVVQTIIDMINDIPSYIIRREVFDIRTCEYFCEANGIDFFPDIPLKYQIRLVQNLNNLIKYKSTDKCIADICKLFGFDNIEIFKYYLMKTQKRNSDGTVVDPDTVDDLSKAYELKFVKVPLEDRVDKYYSDETNHEKYEEIISGDDSWYGPYKQKDVNDNIMKQKFNLVRSKYMSIDAIYSLTDVAFETSYFLNMILYSGINMETVVINIPHIDPKLQFNIQEIFVYLYALMYKYDGVDDANIISGIENMSSVLTFRGFDFDQNLEVLKENIQKQGVSLDELGINIDKFKVTSDVKEWTLDTVVSVYLNNKEIYNHLRKEMKHCKSKKLFDIYNSIYDALMVSSMNSSLFHIVKDPDDPTDTGKPAETYHQWLYYKSATSKYLCDRFDKLVAIAEETTKGEKYDDMMEALYNEMEQVTSTIIDAINNDEITQIFSQFPLDSGDYVKTYMLRIINFFRSHRVLIKDLNNLYTVDEDVVYITDEIGSKESSFTFVQQIPTRDTIDGKNLDLEKNPYGIKVNMEFSDKGPQIYDLIAELSRIYHIDINELFGMYQIKGKLIDTHGYMTHSDNVEIVDRSLEIDYRHYERVMDERYHTLDTLEYNTSSFIREDKVNIYDQLLIEKTYS